MCTESSNKNAEQQDNLEKLYERYCNCRDQELDNFWKKTTYIWTLLTVCFTAYGLLVSNKMNTNYFLFYNSIICFLGITLSCIWLWMSKATKAWYEVYEMAIWEIENFSKKVEYDNQYMIQNFWCLKTKKDFDKKNLVDKMFSTRDFSPSKIVIAIGWLLILFWVMATIYGIGITVVDFITAVECSEVVKQILNGIPILFALFIVFFIRHNIKSSTLRDYSAQELFKNIKNDSEIQELKLYFEVKDNEVCFWTNNSDIINKINEHYRNITPSYYYSNKTVYDFNLINACYNQECEDEQTIKDIKCKFESQKIKTKDVKIFDKVIYINFEGKKYIKDNEKIAKIVSELLKQYNAIKVNYELIK